MIKVICNSIGSTDLCTGCGASVSHYSTSCEPCPVNPNAKCIELPAEPIYKDWDAGELTSIKETKIYESRL